MAISITHPFVSTDSDSGNTTLVQPSDWNNNHTLTLANGKLLGRVSSGTGAFEEIILGAYLSISAGVLSCSISPAPTPYTNYQLFTANGTWTKPAGVTFVFVRCVGGGGGGGGGRPSGAQVSVSQGGGGGVVSEYLFLASSIGATAGIVCGAGGTSGAGAVYPTVLGSAGGRGGSSSFNNAGSPNAKLYAAGGIGGNASGTSFAIGYTSTYGHGNPMSNRYVCSGYGSTSSSNYNGWNGPFGPAGGGVGGGNNAAQPAASYGGAGFANFVGAATSSGQVGSATFGTNTAGTHPDGTNGVNASVKGYGGSGGQGKNNATYSSLPYSGGTGGNGYLGGGGGGGGSFGWSVLPTGTISGGSGGVGGAGFVEVFSW